ncbi:MAG: hypothetical protein V1767_00930 [Chloroflexota bacterium]
MISQLSPLFSKVSTFVRPEDFLLQKGQWVKFSSAWQGNFPENLPGGSFIVKEEPVLVKYDISRIIPGNDFVDIDLSNQTMPTAAGVGGTQQLYPSQPGVLYQIVLGFKKGNYFIPFYIPGGSPIFTLSSSFLTSPNFAAADGRRYLGSKTYRDSPEDTPLISLYTIQNMPSIVLRYYADIGINFEKIVVTYNVNKCKISPIQLSPEQEERALKIPYYTEFVNF